jgi:thioredoxin 1
MIDELTDYSQWQTKVMDS